MPPNTGQRPRPVPAHPARFRLLDHVQTVLKQRTEPPKPCRKAPWLRPLLQVRSCALLERAEPGITLKGSRWLLRATGSGKDAVRGHVALLPPLRTRIPLASWGDHLLKGARMEAPSLDEELQTGKGTLM